MVLLDVCLQHNKPPWSKKVISDCRIGMKSLLEENQMPISFEFLVIVLAIVFFVLYLLCNFGLEPLVINAANKRLLVIEGRNNVYAVCKLSDYLLQAGKDDAMSFAYEKKTQSLPVKVKETMIFTDQDLPQRTGTIEDMNKLIQENYPMIYGSPRGHYHGVKRHLFVPFVETAIYSEIEQKTFYTKIISLEEAHKKVYGYAADEKVGVARKVFNYFVKQFADERSETKSIVKLRQSLALATICAGGLVLIQHADWIIKKLPNPTKTSTSLKIENGKVVAETIAAPPGTIPMMPDDTMKGGNIIDLCIIVEAPKYAGNGLSMVRVKRKFNNDDTFDILTIASPEYIPGAEVLVRSSLIRGSGNVNVLEFWIVSQEEADALVSTGHFNFREP